MPLHSHPLRSNPVMPARDSEPRICRTATDSPQDVGSEIERTPALKRTNTLSHASPRYQPGLRRANTVGREAGLPTRQPETESCGLTRQPEVRRPNIETEIEPNSEKQRHRKVTMAGSRPSSAPRPFSFKVGPDTIGPTRNHVNPMASLPEHDEVQITRQEPDKFKTHTRIVSVIRSSKPEVPLLLSPVQSVDPTTVILSLNNRLRTVAKQLEFLDITDRQKQNPTGLLIKTKLQRMLKQSPRDPNTLAASSGHAVNELQEWKDMTQVMLGKFPFLMKDARGIAGEGPLFMELLGLVQDAEQFVAGFGGNGR